MLARIAHELYWIGRQLARAEHTSADARRRLPRRPPGPPGRPGGRAAELGRAADDRLRRAARESASRDEVLRLLTLDPEHPTSVLNCVTRAREGARTVRDVFSGEMWECINTFHLGLLQRNVSAAVQTGPYSVYAYVRERCGMFWGVTEPHDAARRGPRVPAGGRRDRVRRHGPADAARGAAARRRGVRGAPARRAGAGAAAGRRRLPGLPALACPRRRTPARSPASCSSSATTRTRSRSRSRRCTTR